MSSYNGNGIYLTIDGLDVSSEFKSVSLEPTIETVDTTRGAGTDHRKRNEGLRDTAFSCSLGYDTAKVPTWLPVLRPGLHTIVFGPEGSAAGKPKHQQDFITTEAPLEISVEKDEVLFDISGEAAAPPVFDMFAGATF